MVVTRRTQKIINMRPKTSFNDKKCGLVQQYITLICRHITVQHYADRGPAAIQGSIRLGLVGTSQSPSVSRANLSSSSKIHSSLYHSCKKVSEGLTINTILMKTPHNSKLRQKIRLEENQRRQPVEHYNLTQHHLYLCGVFTGTEGSKILTFLLKNMLLTVSYMQN